MSDYIFPDNRYGDALQMVYNEINRAKKKHPGDFNHHHQGFSIMNEEVDEMWDEIKKDNINAAAYEAIQVAAMAVRFAAELGKYPYSKPQTSQRITPEMIEQFKKSFDEYILRNITTNL